jgi:hypothetical protein
MRVFSKERNLKVGQNRSHAYKNGVAFVKALYGSQGSKLMTLRQWTVRNKVPYATAASWAAQKGKGRAIPRKWAEYWSREYGVPISAESWPNGIEK